jgi:hypothetical protein
MNEIKQTEIQEAKNYVIFIFLMILPLQIDGIEAMARSVVHGHASDIVGAIYGCCLERFQAVTNRDCKSSLPHAASVHEWLQSLDNRRCLPPSVL